MQACMVKLATEDDEARWDDKGEVAKEKSVEESNLISFGLVDRERQTERQTERWTRSMV